VQKGNVSQILHTRSIETRANIHLQHREIVANPRKKEQKAFRFVLGFSSVFSSTFLVSVIQKFQKIQ
jgi:hypothetical protein